MPEIAKAIVAAAAPRPFPNPNTVAEARQLRRDGKNVAAPVVGCALNAQTADIGEHLRYKRKRRGFEERPRLASCRMQASRV